VLLLVGLLLVPVALAVGSDVTARLAPQVAVQQADRHQITGEVLAAPGDADGTRTETADHQWRAPVRWVGVDGTVRVSDVRVPSHIRPGDARMLWVDREDRLVAAPMTPDRPAAQGFLTAVLILVGDLVGSWLLLVALRWVLDRARFRAWDAAWRRFTGPDTETAR
jgi:hypothetical protein